MRPSILLTLVVAACVAGCTPPAAKNDVVVVQTPPPPAANAPAPVPETPSQPATPTQGNRPAPPAPAAAPPPPAPVPGGADPIVGDWRMDQPQFTLYMQIKADGKTAINLEKTRASLKALEEKVVQSSKPEDREKARLVLQTTTDKQIKLLAEYHGSWKRKRDFYEMTSYSSSIDKNPSVTHARIDGEKLVSTNGQGVPKEGEPPAFRDP